MEWTRFEAKLIYAAVVAAVLFLVGALRRRYVHGGSRRGPSRLTNGEILEKYRGKDSSRPE